MVEIFDWANEVYGILLRQLKHVHPSTVLRYIEEVEEHLKEPIYYDSQEITEIYISNAHGVDVYIPSDDEEWRLYDHAESCIHEIITIGLGYVKDDLLTKFKWLEKKNPDNPLKHMGFLNKCEKGKLYAINKMGVEAFEDKSIKKYLTKLKYTDKVIAFAY